MFLTSPNNPDGSLIQEQQLKSILQLPVLVVLDEAYIEFADEPSRLKWVQQYDNLVVLRTFSKSAALAGIRVGYGSFPLSMIDYLWRAKQPYNVSAASEVAACAALQNMAYLKVGFFLLAACKHCTYVQSAWLLPTLPVRHPAYDTHHTLLIFSLAGLTDKYVCRT